MADGGLTLHLDDALAERLRAAAAEAGEPVDVYARGALERLVATDSDWTLHDEAVAQFERDGVATPLDEAMTRFRDLVRKHLDERA